MCAGHLTVVCPGLRLFALGMCVRIFRILKEKKIGFGL